MDYRLPLLNDVGRSIAVVLKHAATCCPPPCRPISFTLDVSQPRTLGRRAIYVAAGAMAMPRFAENRQFCQETDALGEGSCGRNAIIKRIRVTGWMWAPTPERPDAVEAAAAEHVEAAAAYHPPRTFSLVAYRRPILHTLGGHLLWPLRAVVAAAAEARSTVPVSRHWAAGQPQTARVHIGREYTRARPRRDEVSPRSRPPRPRTPTVAPPPLIAEFPLAWVGEGLLSVSHRPSFISPIPGKQKVSKPVAQKTAAGSRQLQATRRRETTSCERLQRRLR